MRWEKEGTAEKREQTKMVEGVVSGGEGGKCVGSGSRLMCPSRLAWEARPFLTFPSLNEVIYD